MDLNVDSGSRSLFGWFNGTTNIFGYWLTNVTATNASCAGGSYVNTNFYGGAPAGVVCNIGYSAGFIGSPATNSVGSPVILGGQPSQIILFDEGGTPHTLSVSVNNGGSLWLSGTNALPYSTAVGPVYSGSSNLLWSVINGTSNAIYGKPWP